MLCSAVRTHTAVKLGLKQSSLLRCDALGKLQAMILSSYNYSGRKESSKQGMNSQKYDLAKEINLYAVICRSAKGCKKDNLQKGGE